MKKQIPHQATLRNGEKAVITGTLKNKYPLPKLCFKKEHPQNHEVSSYVVKMRREHKYNSYQCELSVASENFIFRQL